MFDGYLKKWGTTLKIAKHTAGPLCRWANFLGYDDSDIEQVLLLKLAYCARLYNPSNPAGASFDTFFNATVRRAINHLVNPHRAGKNTPPGGRVLSADAELSDDGDKIWDYVGTSDGDTPAEVRETILPLTESLKWLDPRDRKVIELRFGLGDLPEMTLEEAGQELGITRERVRQIEKRALQRISDRLRGTKLELEMLGISA